MTVNELIEKLVELKGRDLDNGDLPIVLGLTGETMPDEVYVEHFDGDQRLPFVRICSIKDERLGPAAFGRFS